MAAFKYKALDRVGKLTEGKVEASSQNAAYAIISKRNLDIYEIRELPPQFRIFQLSKRVSGKKHARYIRQLATLLNAGVALMDALNSMARSSANPTLSEASRNIASELRSGKRLSVAIEKHLPGLPNYVPRLAELGEATGQPAKALTDAADRMEFEDDMRSQFRTALSYPIFLSVVGGAIVLLMFFFVVPKFDELIGDKRDSLPFISDLVLSFGTTLRSNPFLVGSIIILFIGLLVVTIRSKTIRGQIRMRLERIPLIGPLLKQADIGGWARTMGMALTNGASLLDALNLSESGLNSPRLRNSLREARREIRTGRNIDDVLEERVSDIDPLTIDLIRTGRTSGTLGEMFLFVGEAQEAETQEISKRLSTLAEPLAILAISAIVGTIVIAIVLAMTSLYDFSI